MRRVLNMIRNIANWPQYLVFKTFGKKQNEFTFKCRRAFDVRVPVRMLHTFKECFFDETYIKGFPKDLFKNKSITAIDIGANVGYFSLYMLAKFPGSKVYAYEPMPKNYALLDSYRKTLGNNSLIANNKAVSDVAGYLKINYDANDSFSTNASVFSVSQATDVIEVPSVTLASIMEEYKLASIDFLKLDCEGSEYAILYNTPASVLKKITALAIETHIGKASNQNTEALVKYLDQQGFAVRQQKDIVWAWQ